MNSRFMLALAIAVLLDLVDWALVGLIPGLGDLLDLGGIAILFPLIGPAALFGVVEFIPILGDLSPSFVVAVVLSRTSLLKRLTSETEEEETAGS